MENVVYKEMAPEERMLDWRITRLVMADSVLMNTLQASQAGEKSTPSSPWWKTASSRRPT